MTSFEKCLFISFIHFHLIDFLWLSTPCICIFTPQQINIFSHSTCCLFTLLIVLFPIYMLFSSIQSHLSIIAYWLEIMSENVPSRLMSWSVPLSVLFKYLINLRFFSYMGWEGVWFYSFFFSASRCTVVSIAFNEEIVFSPLGILCTLSKLKQQ